MQNLNYPRLNCRSLFLLILDLSIFIIVATVPTGLHTCAKVLQMHLSGGGGTIWLQPKSNVTFKLTSVDVFKVLYSDFGFKYFYYSGHCAHRFANLRKNAANALFRGWGKPWMQPKSNGKMKLTLCHVLKFLAAYFEFKYFHYSGHCAHRIANLCKSAANAPSRGWGATLVATKK